MDESFTEQPELISPEEVVPVESVSEQEGEGVAPGIAFQAESAPAEEPDRTEELRAENEALLAQLTAFYRAQPEVVPELVQGRNAAELAGSFAEAQRVYRRLQQQFQPQKSEFAPPPVAAGGGERRPARPVAKLSPVEKIAQGLAQR